ncbi:MAG: FumA C-terminus/TtdB family hydratase beta subunit [Deltaproteobacteria bacterium]|nr:FumA C-terminus/TtdB family hydratase beta subunit [Deltaproteobacteria bacterium]
MLQGCQSIRTPFRDNEHRSLRAGEIVLLSGFVYCARDAAHLRFQEAIQKEEKLPLNLSDETIFYAAPTPTRADGSIGAIGPTTSSRMDTFTPALLKQTGLKGMIGKGFRSEVVRDAIFSNRAIYLGAIGGVAALIRKYVLSVRTVAYADLSAEAVLCVELVDFPLVVVIDSLGNQIGA